MMVALVSASNAVTHFLLHAGFSSDHIKHGRTLTSPGVPLPALDLLTNAATDVPERANNLSGILRTTAMDAMMRFPSLVRPLTPRGRGMQHASPHRGETTPDPLGRRAARIPCSPRKNIKNAKTLYFGDDRAPNHIHVR